MKYETRYILTEVGPDAGLTKTELLQELAEELGFDLLPIEDV